MFTESILGQIQDFQMSAFTVKKMINHVATDVILAAVERGNQTCRALYCSENFDELLVAKPVS